MKFNVIANINLLKDEKENDLLNTIKSNKDIDNCNILNNSTLIIQIIKNNSKGNI